MPELEPAAPVTESKSGPPPSVTNFGLNMIALAVVILARYALHQHLFPEWMHVDPVAFLCAAVAVPVVVLDVLVLRVHLRPTTGMDWEKPFSFDWERVLTKIMGLVVT